MTRWGGQALSPTAALAMAEPRLTPVKLGTVLVVHHYPVTLGGNTERGKHRWETPPTYTSSLSHGGEEKTYFPSVFRRALRADGEEHLLPLD